MKGRSPKSPVSEFVPPYPPSWIDRVLQRLDSLPGPAWLTFLVLGVAGIALQLGIQVSSGDYHPGPYLRLHVWLMGSFAYLLAMIFYLDKSAASAAERFRPVLKSSDPKAPADEHSMSYAELRYRLTILPPRLAIWSGVLGALFLGFGSLFWLARTPAALMTTFNLSARPLPMTVALSHYVLTQAIAGMLILHTIRQLRLINHIYLHNARLNLYRLQPLYAFSIPAALTAGGFLVYNYIWFAAAPPLLEHPVGRTLGIFFSAIAVLTFAWPLWGVHRRLVQEKKKLLLESSTHFEAAVAQLHDRINRDQLSEMDDLHKTLTSLEIEQAALRRIPTWPWEPGVMRGVMAAVFLPIIIWLIQTLLEKLLK